jgi:hypothetical protein
MKRCVGSVKLAFNEEKEKQFFSVAPFVEPNAEGTFPLTGKAPALKHKLEITILKGNC